MHDWHRKSPPYKVSNITSITTLADSSMSATEQILVTCQVQRFCIAFLIHLDFIDKLVDKASNSSKRHLNHARKKGLTGLHLLHGPNSIIASWPGALALMVNSACPMLPVLSSALNATISTQ